MRNLGGRRAAARMGGAALALVAVATTVSVEPWADRAPATVRTAGTTAASAPVSTPRATAGSPAALDRGAVPPLGAQLDRLLGARAGDVSAVGVNLRTGQTVAYGQTGGMATASIAKLDILLTHLFQEQDAGTMPSSAEAAMAGRMIRNSDNEAATSLWNAVGGGPGVSAVNQRLGLVATVPGPSSYWGSTTTNAGDQVKLIEAVISPTSRLRPAYRSYALKLLESVQVDQRWGVSAAGTSGTVALKNGWLPRVGDGNRWVVNSVGRVTAEGDPLLLAVLSRYSSTMPAGIDLIEDVAVVLRDALVARRAS